MSELHDSIQSNLRCEHYYNPWRTRKHNYIQQQWHQIQMLVLMATNQPFIQMCSSNKTLIVHSSKCYLLSSQTSSSASRSTVLQRQFRNNRRAVVSVEKVSSACHLYKGRKESEPIRRSLYTQFKYPEQQNSPTKITCSKLFLFSHVMCRFWTHFEMRTVLSNHNMCNPLYGIASHRSLHINST